MFKRVIDETASEVVFDFEGTEVTARNGESVGAALLGAGVLSFRQTPVKDRARGPFCMMGVCFDCLMVIDGQPNRQACQIVAASGMKVARQIGAAELNIEQADPS